MMEVIRLIYEESIKLLKRQGVEFETGLTVEEIAKIEDIYIIKFLFHFSPYNSIPNSNYLIIKTNIIVFPRSCPSQDFNRYSYFYFHYITVKVGKYLFTYFFWVLQN